jgi:predicted PurR-regulated permease PerM
LFLRLATVAVILYVLYRIGFILVVVVISVMLALALAPLVGWLERSSLLGFLKGHSRRGVAATVVFLLLAVSLIGLAVVIVQPLAGEIREFAANWALHQAEWSRRVDWMQQRYANLPDSVRLWITENGVKDIGARTGEQVQHLAHRTVESGMVLVEMILIPVLAFSFLTESAPLKRELILCLPRERVRDGLYLMRQCGIILQSYAVGQLILALIAGVVVWLMMTGMGIRYALALAVIAAVTRVIPVIGPIVGGIPIVLFASLQGWDRGLAVLIGFTIMHLIESKVVMPRIIGYRIHLHPAIVIIVLLIGAEFFGMWGMFLAAPVAAVVKVFFQYLVVRPRLHRHHLAALAAGSLPEKEADVERPAGAGVRSHSGAH